MSASGEVGTPAWTAPEVLNHDRVSLKSDVFSFGIVMWEIMTWLPPTILLPQREITRQIKKKNEQLRKVIGNVFGVTKTSQKMSPKINAGRPIKGKGGGRGREIHGTDSQGRKTRSDSEDGGRRRVDPGGCDIRCCWRGSGRRLCRWRGGGCCREVKRGVGRVRNVVERARRRGAIFAFCDNPPP